MNILKKIPTLLLFATVCYSPLMAQKKLALANECFNAEAYYLASRYYQEFFGQMKDCHPDQLKMAQSLVATNQVDVAETVFIDYLKCQHHSPEASFTYGKFLMDIGSYKKAILYLKKGKSTDPQLARHYMLACQTALYKTEPVENEAIVVSQIKQSVPAPAAATTEQEKSVPKILVNKNQPEQPVYTVNTAKEINSVQTEPTNTAIKKINLYDAMASTDKPEKIKIAGAPAKKIITTIMPEQPAKSDISPYGVRLGTYKSAAVPDLTSVAHYGTIEERKWNGKKIIFLVDFPSRAAAEAVVTVARQENFRSATLVEKLASGRMKSVR